MKKAAIILLTAVLLIGLCTALMLLVIGEPVDGDTLAIDVQELDKQVNIHVSTPTSAIAFTDAKLRQEGTVLHISMRKVLVSPLYSSGTKMIWIEKCDLTEIWLGGRKIWSLK